MTAMVDPSTQPKELGELLEIFRLALAVHTATETRILDNLMCRVRAAQRLERMVTQARLEHVQQRCLADNMTMVRPASIGWYEAALELRVAVLDHSVRADDLRWALQSDVPADLERTLAAEYATERMRVLATTSPFLVAQRRVVSHHAY